MTNADKIRAMTDEELARLFNCDNNCPPDTQLIANCPYYADDATLCHSCWLNWLQKEADE